MFKKLFYSQKHKKIKIKKGLHKTLNYFNIPFDGFQLSKFF